MELTQKDLLYTNNLSNDTIKVKKQKEVIENKNIEILNNLDEKTEYKTGYREINLDSLGKLSAPSKLNYRNYQMDELIDLASLREDRQIEGLVNCLNNMCGSDFDNGDLHFNELIEIMIFLYSAWGREIKLSYFLVDENNNIIDDKEKYATINIKDIKTKPIKEEFKEPINIGDENIQVSFVLPRLNHIIKAKRFIREKYKSERRKFSDLEMVLEENSSIDDISKRKLIDPDLYEEYVSYREKANKDVYIITQIMLIKSINGKDLTDEERLTRYNEIPLDFWVKYNSIAEEYSDFGVISKIEVFNEFKQVKEIRRYQFRLNTLLPTLESKNNKRYNVSFG